MLKIKGYSNIVGESFRIDKGKGSPTLYYIIERIDEHQNFYDFIIRNVETGYTAVIGLHRHSKTEYRGERTYILLWNGIDSRIEVTAGYISDHGVMIGVLKNVIDNNNF
jgi:hypothetical protein